jgi:hypothetical protein
MAKSCHSGPAWAFSSDGTCRLYFKAGPRSVDLLDFLYRLDPFHWSGELGVRMVSMPEMQQDIRREVVSSGAARVCTPMSSLRFAEIRRELTRIAARRFSLLRFDEYTKMCDSYT